MRTAIALLILIVIPASGYSHPGKTDLYGGHKCFKKCEDWGLLYAEYHLHDKEGRPIRVSRQKAIRKSSLKKASPAEIEPAIPDAAPKPAGQAAPVTVARSLSVPADNGFFPIPFLLALLALLLVLLVMRVRRRKDEEGTPKQMPRQ